MEKEHKDFLESFKNKTINGINVVYGVLKIQIDSEGEYEDLSIWAEHADYQLIDNDKLVFFSNSRIKTSSECENELWLVIGNKIIDLDIEDDRYLCLFLSKYIFRIGPYDYNYKDIDDPDIWWLYKDQYNILCLGNDGLYYE